MSIKNLIYFLRKFRSAHYVIVEIGRRISVWFPVVRVIKWCMSISVIVSVLWAKFKFLKIKIINLINNMSNILKIKRALVFKKRSSFLKISVFESDILYTLTLMPYVVYRQNRHLFRSWLIHLSPMLQLGEAELEHVVHSRYELPLHPWSTHISLAFRPKIFSMIGAFCF